jgi:hypothetical protein
MAGPSLWPVLASLKPSGIFLYPSTAFKVSAIGEFERVAQCRAGFDRATRKNAFRPGKYRTFH